MEPNHHDGVPQLYAETLKGSCSEEPLPKISIDFALEADMKKPKIFLKGTETSLPKGAPLSCLLVNGNICLVGGGLGMLKNALEEILESAFAEDGNIRAFFAERCQEGYVNCFGSFVPTEPQPMPFEQGSVEIRKPLAVWRPFWDLQVADGDNKTAFFRQVVDGKPVLKKHTVGADAVGYYVLNHFGNKKRGEELADVVNGKWIDVQPEAQSFDADRLIAIADFHERMRYDMLTNKAYKLSSAVLEQQSQKAPDAPETNQPAHLPQALNLSWNKYPHKHPTKNGQYLVAMSTPRSATELDTKLSVLIIADSIFEGDGQFMFETRKICYWAQLPTL